MGAPSTSFMPVITMSSDDIDDCFPDVDPNYEPCGSEVCVQIRVAKRRVSRDSKIELADETREIIQANQQVARVVSVGPLAFHNRNTMVPWPEGAWVQPGDFIRIGLYSGDKWEIPHGDGVVMFRSIKDLEIKGKIPRPLEVIAYI